MDFSDLIAPIPADRFMRDYFGRKPLHIPGNGEGGSGRRGLLPWERLNAILAQRPHWTPGNIKLIMNNHPVGSEHYLDPVPTAEGVAMRADPAKVHHFLAMGASLVADALEDVDPAIAQVVSMLGTTFAAKGGANAYCSFRDVQAFASHCDTHEVFAIQLHGEKSWRVYENRAEAPVRALTGDGAQAIIDRAKGGVAMEVLMRPGDLIYLPRGFYHDATARSDVSLHLTLAVLPMTGVAALRMLVDQAEEDPVLRAYLADGRDAGALADHLATLAEKITATLESPLFRSDVIVRQRSLAGRYYQPNLPDRPALSFYAATGRPAQVLRRAEGAVLRHGNGEDPLGLLSGPAQWVLEQQAFAVQQLAARFAWMQPGEVTTLIRLFEQAGLIQAYQPQM
jgi:hypothetical protein